MPEKSLHQLILDMINYSRQLYSKDELDRKKSNILYNVCADIDIVIYNFILKSKKNILKSRDIIAVEIKQLHHQIKKAKKEMENMDCPQTYFLLSRITQAATEIYNHSFFTEFTNETLHENCTSNM